MLPTRGPTLASPHRYAAPNNRSTSPLPPPVPAKPIDLNSSTRSTDKETGNKVTRRAFLCDVVVEREGEETSNLLQHLGAPLTPLSTLPIPAVPTLSRPTTPSPLSQAIDDDLESDRAIWTREKQAQTSKRLSMLIEELVRTERSYSMRVQALKKNYADPLRNFARQDFSKIIPMYEAKTLFTNIDAIVAASKLFLEDLEKMWASAQGETTVGDICLRHLKDLRTLDPYRTYLSKQDESQKMFQDVLKKHSSFGSFIERTKYQTNGIGNIGLRELLMEPVQRIPRYTLLWQTMLKCMSPLAPQRAKLQEAVEIASRIARCEPDAQTVRATVMYCLERNVDGFPANLYSNNRDFIDSIDVDDIPVELPTSSSPGGTHLSHSRHLSVTSASNSTPSLASFGSSASSSQIPLSPQSNGASSTVGLAPLPCTLFLFDDKLMIVKRQSNTLSGRKVTGLNDVQKLVKDGGGVAVLDKSGSKKDKLSFRGIVDVLDIIAADAGNGDFHLLLDKPPIDLGDRWSGRPFRFYSTVQPPFTSSIDPVAVRQDKLRFMQSLWAAQAQARAKLLPNEVETRAVPRVMMSDDEIGLEPAGEMFARAKCFWNVWERKDWISDGRKAKVAVHVDEDGAAPELQLADGDPSVIIRLQPLTGALCRFSFRVGDSGGESRELIDYSDVLEKIVTTIHRVGVFNARSSSTSCPTTPSGSGNRVRTSMLNLDTISRNLFGQASVSGRNQTGGSSDLFGSTRTKRSRSIVSRSSTVDTNRISNSSGSSRELKNSGLPSSPSEHPSDAEVEPLAAASTFADVRRNMGQSEIDLNERLNLARKNSKTMAAMSPGHARLGAKSVAELRTLADERDAELKRSASKLVTKSLVDLRRNEGPMNPTEASLREALRASSPTPLSPTAPLRIRSKTPSPTRPLTPPDDTPRPSNDGMTSVLSIPALRPLTSDMHIQVLAASAASPSRQLPSPPPRPPSIPLNVPPSPRPLGPRGPAPRSLPPVAGMGSARTSLRVMSGGGRRVSPGRETIPLKGDENESPLPDADQSWSSNKRQHSSDQLSPRKKEPLRSPLQPRTEDQESQLADPPRVPSISSGSGSRRSSGRKTPQRSNGHLVTPRRVSAGTASITSQTSNATTDDIVMDDLVDVGSTAEGVKRRIMESRAMVKRLKSDIQNLRKQLSKDAVSKSGAWADRNGSLPRSPQRRDIHRFADQNKILSDELPSSVSSRLSTMSKHELDILLIDEITRGMSAMVEKLENHLSAAHTENNQTEVITGRLLLDSSERAIEIQQLQAQVQRAKESQELLRHQLSDVQVEVDVIYEAFNTELDGMFNDAQLPETEAFDAMRRDLQSAKASRNELALENMKLKRELAEANLKREQWAKVLREQGVLG